MSRNNSFARLLMIIGVFVFSTSGFSQTDDTKITDSTSTKPVMEMDSISKAPSKLKFGMGFGMNFVGGTNINVSPNLIYNATDTFRFGGGLQFSLSSIKDVRSTTTIGANVIAFYDLGKTVTTLLEFVELNVATKDQTTEGEIKDNYWDTALFVGAGFNITRKITVGAKYNMLYKEDESVYTSAVVPFVNIAF